MSTESVSSGARRWVLAERPPTSVTDALRAFGPVVTQLLFNRGITHAEDADLYLRPDERLECDPFLLPDMNRAVERVTRALDSKETIGVYGDYDADGVTSTALFLEAFRPLAAQVIPYIPNRTTEGYGVNANALAWLSDQGATLVITGDCGVGGVSGGPVPPGLDVVVTDHHLPPETLPPFAAIVDPMLPGSKYPSPQLAGVGVAYKLVQALYRTLGERIPPRLLELVALGTIADVAPLVGENRFLVREGLNQMRATNRPGLRALAASANVDIQSITEEDIGFQIGPRINAAGRMAHANVSLELLLTPDEDKARAIASKLGELNQNRRALTAEAVKIAHDLVAEQDPDQRLIMVGARGFAPGLVGLVAGRLAEEFYRPALVYTITGGDEISGSARSIPEFDMAHALSLCQGLLTRYGGHHQAAGFAAKQADVDALRNQLTGLADTALDGADLRPTFHLDAAGSPSAMERPIMDNLEKMAPFGQGNRSPLFRGDSLEVTSARAVGRDGGTLRLTLRESRSGARWNAVGFRQGARAAEARGLIDIAFRYHMNNGAPGSGYAPRLELEVLDFRRA